MLLTDNETKRQTKRQIDNQTKIDESMSLAVGIVIELYFEVIKSRMYFEITTNSVVISLPIHGLAPCIYEIEF